MEEFTKEGVVEREGVMYVGGHRSVARLASALANETRAKIIELLATGPKDLDYIAREIKQSKANVSSQIRRLEEAGIVESVYLPGERGIKKMVKMRVSKIVFNLSIERD
ncbi:MAG: winged helix-turn-helix domain-containing protein [Acidilobaceae archaeon]|nr:winged helix-turn-helix domain-containing protein [Acidilobaceae archaeon]MCX8166135.1 winged helix-turn-helix domain-containing protein [Acidilobaceae archaeon]